MSSLQRYKKSGGFAQLLSLIETFGPQKKEKFLEMIEAESMVWARALREKMITFDRIFGWPEQIVVEVFKQLQPKTLAFALSGINPEQKDKILAYFSHAEKRRLDDILTESKPKPDEIAATLVKVVEQCRKMLKNRELHADKFDPSLLIPEDYEVKLEEQATHEQFKAMSGGGASSAAASNPATASAPMSQAAKDTVRVQAQEAEAAADAHHAGAVDTLQLQKKIQQILKENKMLKEENQALKAKLDSIKKIA